MAYQGPREGRMRERRVQLRYTRVGTMAIFLGRLRSFTGHLFNEHKVIEPVAGGNPIRFYNRLEFGKFLVCY